MTSMAAGTFFWHAMNFLAPAAAVALLLGVAARLVHGPLLVPLWWAVGLNFVLGSLVLGLGLVLSGRIQNPTATNGILAATASRARGWDDLRPADAPWPVRDWVESLGNVRTPRVGRGTD